MKFIGIDIGGTKISVCLGECEGNILASRRIATQPLGGAKRGLPAIAEEIEALQPNWKEIEAIGISSPGPISSKEGMMLAPPNLKGWEGTRLVDYFADRFQKPAYMNHDAKAAALAEVLFGHAKGTANLVYLTTSTGMGGGAIVGGHLVQGASDTATEVGHYVLDPTGPLCPCGQRGCFEAFCGGAMLAKKMQEEIGQREIDTAVLREAGGDLKKIDAACLIRAVGQSDPYALEVWNGFIERLAQGIGIVLMAFNPEAIILGTMAKHAGLLLLDPLNRALPRFAWKEALQACRIEASRLEKISELSGIAVAVTDFRRHRHEGSGR